MTTFLRGATALVALGGPLWASSGTTSDWLGLDEELNSLASTVTLQGNEPNFGGLLRTNVLWSDDFNGGTPGAEDLLGADITDAKLWAQGDVGEIGWRVMMDFANFGESAPGAGDEVTYLADLFAGSPGAEYSAQLQDAYATWNLSESLTLTFGRFRAPTTRSMWVPSEQLLFQNRSLLGEFGYQFNEGVMLSGSYESNLSWWLSAQNGIDGLEDDLSFNGRVEYALGMPAPTFEGAFLSTNEIEATIGVFYGDEGQLGSGSYLGGDLTANMGSLSFYGELTDFDDDWAPVLGSRFGSVFDAGGATPWSVTLSLMLQPETWEIAARYEELDDLGDTRLLTLGANYYLTGHNAKAQFNVIDISSDVDAQEGTIFGLGLVVGLEGYGV